jgi:hypothetical protein
MNFDADTGREEAAPGLWMQWGLEDFFQQTSFQTRQLLAKL